VPIGTGRMDAGAFSAMVATFHQIYEREYTYRLDAAIEIVGLHVIALAEVGKLEIVTLPKTGARIEDAVKGRRQVDYATEGVHEATIYDAEKLEPGMRFPGPAVIEDPGTTIVVHPANTVWIDDYGNTHIEIGG
ncbi:MAG TPA: hydantoinase/oxoprolinase family protein, partial [Sphingomonas sp.]